MIEFGWTENDWDSEWPQEKDISQFPSYKKIKLSALKYKHINNADELCGLQLVFTNGMSSDLYETSEAKERESDLKTIQIDTSKEIRQVSMKIWNGFAIKGLRLTDGDGNNLINLNWAAVGQWTV